jgi:hypothetical protein|tara:strand:+ start:647 stop:835 length:189 start_codon:yes stop_codon:yes gene_type:complete
MAIKKDSIDLVNDPLRQAQQMYQQQVEQFQQQATDNRPNPLKKIYRDKGLDLASIRRGMTKR